MWCWQLSWIFGRCITVLSDLSSRSPPHLFYDDNSQAVRVSWQLPWGFLLWCLLSVAWKGRARCASHPGRAHKATCSTKKDLVKEASTAQVRVTQRINGSPRKISKPMMVRRLVAAKLGASGEEAVKLAVKTIHDKFCLLNPTKYRNKACTINST